MSQSNRILHIANDQGRDANISFVSVRKPSSPAQGLPNETIRFRRYLSATQTTMHEALSLKHGEDYAQALIDTDPEIDIELVGRTIKNTSTIQLSADGQVLYSVPEVVEIVFGPDGEEKERRAPEDNEANINTEIPLRWTGRMLSKEDATKRFLFSRTIQLRHHDGLTYDFLFSMAKTLSDADKMVLIGAGEKGKDPLVLNINGRPYRAFLEGRIDGKRYQLLMRLSNMELKSIKKEEA